MDYSIVNRTCESINIGSLNPIKVEGSESMYRLGGLQMKLGSLAIVITHYKSKFYKI